MKYIKPTLIALAFIILFITLWSANRDRLQEYDNYYLCDIYGKQEYCN